MFIVIAILAFCIIIIIHEMGHFFAAKACGMKVSEFSLGMGPKILKKQGKETLYTVKLLPIGGSVQLGEDEESDDPRSFRNKPVWQRMIVLAAGPVMNLILGVIVCAAAILISGRVVTSQIGGFRGDNPISSQYLQAGDEILEINGHSIWSSMDISYALQNSAMKATPNDEYLSYSFKVNRGGETVVLDNVKFALRRDDNEEPSVILDFYVNAYSADFNNIGKIAAYSFKEAATYGRLVWVSLIDLLNGTYGLNDLSGPVGTVTVISQTATASADMRINITNLMSMIALITINLGIFNLLPVPALDGSRIIFLIIELIRRKPMKPEHEGMVHFVGFAALMLLMLVVTFNDIVKLVTGG